MDAASGFSSLLSAIGIRNDGLLAEALRLHSQPPATPFRLSTSVLGKVLRTLKALAPVESRRQVEESFMSLVTKDNGTLPDMLSVLASALGDSELEAVLLADTPPEVQPQPAQGSAPPGPGAAPRRAGREQPRDSSAQAQHSAHVQLPAARGSSTGRVADPPGGTFSSASRDAPESIRRDARAGVAATSRPLAGPPSLAAGPTASGPSSGGGPSVFDAAAYRRGLESRDAPPSAAFHASASPDASLRSQAPPPQQQFASGAAGVHGSGKNLSTAVSFDSTVAAPPRRLATDTPAAAAPQQLEVYRGPPVTPVDAAVERALDQLLGWAAAQDDAFEAASRSSRASAWRSLELPGAAAARVRGALHYGDLVLLSVPDRTANVRCYTGDGSSGAGAGHAQQQRVLRLSIEAGVGGGLIGEGHVWRILPADGIDRRPAGLAGRPVRSGSTVVLRQAHSGHALSAVDASSRAIPLRSLVSLTVSAAEGVGATASAAVALLPLASSGVVPVSGADGASTHSVSAQQRWVIVSPDAAMAAAAALGSSRARERPTESPEPPFVMASQHFALLCHGTGPGSGASAEGGSSASQGARAAVLQMQALQRIPGSAESIVDTVLPAGARQRLGSVGSALLAQFDTLASRQAAGLPHAALWSCSLVDDSPGQLDAAAVAASEGAVMGSAEGQLRAWRAHATIPEWSVCRPFTAAAFAGPIDAVPHRYAAALERTRRLAAQGAGNTATATVRAVAQLPTPAQEALLVQAALLGLHGFPCDLFSVSATTRRVAVHGGEGGSARDARGGPMAGSLLHEGVTVAVLASVPPDTARGTQAAALDRSLVALTERLCPLMARALECRWAVEELGREGSGRVAQALAAAARAVLREFASTLLRMEEQAAAATKAPADGEGGTTRHGSDLLPPSGATPVSVMSAAAAAGGRGSAAAVAALLGRPIPPLTLTLQHAWCVLQPAMRTLDALGAALAACEGRTGGALLDSLAEALIRGADDGARNLALFLLERAAEPFLRMLEQWVFTGVLDDKFHEFMVEAVAAGSSRAGGGGRGGFALRRAMIPRFLAEHAAAILAAGEHLSVLRMWHCLPVELQHDALTGRRGDATRPAPRSLWVASPGSSSGSATDVAGPDKHSGAAAVSARLADGAAWVKDLLGDDAAPTADGNSSPVFPAATRIPFSHDAAAYTSVLQAAAAYSSRQLLGRFRGGPGPRASAAGLDLFARLASLKRYFLLAQGDYLTHFFDIADAELQKEAPPPPALGSAAAVPGYRRTAAGQEHVSLPKLQTLLEVAMRSCATSAGDPYAPAVSAVLAGSSLLALLEAMQSGAPAGELRSLRTAATGLKGYNVFCLDVRVSWPLTLILSPAAMLRYQLLFRHLFFCRYVERSVGGAWVAHQACKELELRATLALSFTLRQKMLHFLQNLTFYMMVEVIEPNWHAMASALRLAGTLDDVAAGHDAFLDACLADCLLSAPDILKLLTKLVTLCLLFSKQIAHAIESHRLSEAELDSRAGLNRASERARAERERGAYFQADRDDDDGASVAPGARGGGAKSVGSRRPSASSAARAPPPPPPAKGGRDRLHRKHRLAVQTEAMQHTMAQYGWQAMILKSNRMFDALLRDLLGALVTRCQGGGGGGGASSRSGSAAARSAENMAHLITRLDFNGFYSRSLGFVGAAGHSAGAAGPGHADK